MLGAGRAVPGSDRPLLTVPPPAVEIGEAVFADRRGERSEHRRETSVATRLEQIGADRGRVHAHGEGVGQVLLRDACGERDHDLAIVARHGESSRQRLAQPIEERARQHMERRARQVHRVVGHPAPVVVDDERVRQLDAEAASALGRVLSERADEVDTAIKLEIVGEGLLLHRHVRVAELVVDDR